MSYYERHVFFCCNQRDNGKNCCNDHGASAIRDYAKRIWGAEPFPITIACDPNAGNDRLAN